MAFTRLGQFWPTSEGDQHFRGNASHVLRACVVMLRLKTIVSKIFFVKNNIIFRLITDGRVPSPSDDGHCWPKHVMAPFHYIKKHCCT
jgi:hypothetical protein